jgi:hypothetical protein
MGRGLSELQKAILMATADEANAEDTRSRADVCNKNAAKYLRRPEPPTLTLALEHYRIGRYAIYDTFYCGFMDNSQVVSVCRALKRLKDRGLIQDQGRWRDSIVPTPEGLAKGRELLKASNG